MKTHILVDRLVNLKPTEENIMMLINEVKDIINGYDFEHKRDKHNMELSLSLGLFNPEELRDNALLCLKIINE